jgi:hypothetical protein
MLVSWRTCTTAGRWSTPESDPLMQQAVGNMPYKQ